MNDENRTPLYFTDDFVKLLREKTKKLKKENDERARRLKIQKKQK
jgi:hypothetical protein